MVVLHGMSCEDLNFGSDDDKPSSLRGTKKEKLKNWSWTTNLVPEKKKKTLLNGWMEMVISQPFPVCKGLESSSI